MGNARTLLSDVSGAGVSADWYDDVADDCAELLAWLLTGCLHGGSPRFSCRQSSEDDAWKAWAMLSSARVGACGHAGRQFLAGFSPVNSYLLPLHDGNVKNMF
jgi:hypothetical protein